MGQDLDHRFLCACLCQNIGEAQALIAHPDWDWERLFSIATKEFVLPALAGCKLDEFLPSNIAASLLAIERLNGERNSAILAEVQFALKKLNAAGVQPVLLKGLAYLAAGVYPNPAGRYLWDADLLVPEDEISKISNSLHQIGFVSQSGDPFARFRHHHTPLGRPDSVSFEFHHSLAIGRYARILPASEVLARSIPVDFNGLNARIPCPEHLVTHLILHSQLHHTYYERIWPPLRALYDLVLLDRRFGPEIHWESIRHRFHSAGQGTILDLHLLQAQESIGFVSQFSIHRTPMLRLRWRRRRFLRRFPLLRYFDPIYMYETLIGRRFRLLGDILRTRAGAVFFLKQLLSPHLYQRFLEDLFAGRGR